MRRLFALLLALVVVLGVSVGPASGSDDDDRDDDDRSEVDDRSGSDDDDDRDDDDRDDDDDEDRSGSNSGSDDDDDDDDDDDEDRSGSNSGSDDDDDDDDDDDSGHGRGRGRGRGRGGRDDTGTGTPGGGAPPAPDPGAPPATSGTVRIVDDAFSPSTVTVATGATVTFTNADDREHTVTADDRSFDSGVMAEGASFAQTFPEAGTFDYFCLIHSDMTGTVVVGDSPASSSSGSSSGAGSSSSATPSLRRSTGGTAQSGGPALSGITPPNSSVPGSITVPAPLAAAAAQDAAVEVRDFAFAPDGVTVGVGATVTWTLVGEAPHTVTGDGFDSGILSAGDTFSQTFDEAGQFDYRCELHPEMTATVTVAAADASGGAPPDDAAGDAAPDDAAPAAGDDPATAGPSLANTGIPISTAIVVIALLGLAALAAFGWSRRGAEE